MAAYNNLLFIIFKELFYYSFYHFILIKLNQNHLSNFALIRPSLGLNNLIFKAVIHLTQSIMQASIILAKHIIYILKATDFIIFFIAKYNMHLLKGLFIYDVFILDTLEAPEQPFLLLLGIT